MRRLLYTTAAGHTGGGHCFSLRDKSDGPCRVDSVAEINCDVGALDAPECLPGGATQVTDAAYADVRWISQRPIPRA